MRVVVTALAALGTGIVTGCVLVYVIRRVIVRRIRYPAPCASSGEFPGDSAAFAEFPGDSAAYTGALAQVTAYACQHEVFRREWETAVRQAADGMTAHIAGLWMAGEAHGTIAWDAPYPAPPAFDGEVLEAAFQLAVHGEVSRRIGAMNGPGAFG